MTLLHGSSGRILTDAMLRRAEDGDFVLVAEERVFTPLQATTEGLLLLDATDEERQRLVESGYALPSEVARLREEEDGG